MCVKLAILRVITVVVLCPTCGEFQPNPYNGGDPGTLEEVTKAAASKEPHTCVSCDVLFHVIAYRRVEMEAQS